MGFLEKVDDVRRRFIKEEFAILMLVLIMASMFFSNPEVIGYASTNIHSQPLNLHIDQSKSIYLEAMENVQLVSLSMSGKIIGQGTVGIYLDNEQGKRLLVFRNTKKAGSRINRITGSVPSNGGSHMFPGAHVSGLSVTADSMPARHAPPTLMIAEGDPLSEVEPLPPEYLSIAGVFSNVCVESCILNANEFTGDRFRLDFLVEPGVTIEITELVYTTFDADEE